MSQTLAALVADDRVHVMDGAMGTLLYGRGVFVNVCYDELNVTDPDLVRSLHREYREAGAEILETNTFGANPVKLLSHGLDAKTESLNREAARLAREAAGGSADEGGAFVLGAMGPLGIRVEPFGPTSLEEAEDYFSRQVHGLLEGDVDGFILETFSDLNELRAGLKAIKALSSLPVFAQITVDEEGNTAYGTSVESAARSMDEWGVDVIGVNCSVGPATLLDAVERMASVTTRPLSVQPNAGLPRAVGDRKIYLASPDYFAQYARRMMEAGARFVGGCCGTTPDHIRAIAGAVAARQPRHALVTPPASGLNGGEPAEPAPLAERSPWGRKLAQGQRVVSVELLPPHGWDPEPLLEQARAFHAAGVDAVTVLDSPRGPARMSALAACSVLRSALGVETVVHYTCRDRNMMGMVSDLLGAAGTGLTNLLLVSGDLPSGGPYPDAGAVFDIDSIGLTNVVRLLNQGVDPGGNPIGQPTRFVIGVALNQGATDLKRELERFHWKMEAGAEFAVTQPVFDPRELDTFLTAAGNPQLPVVAALWPLLSLRNAEFLANEVPGVRVPPEVVQRMAQAQHAGTETAEAEGIALALEMAKGVMDRVQGFHIHVPRGRVDMALRLLDALPGD
ncbi:MAG: bifunctional homocysteine S-methyltransferase/methylenetetrahydrofolate reductase [Gemmatimonadota bacterium]